jgi:hypothetical protein
MTGKLILVIAFSSLVVNLVIFYIDCYHKLYFLFLKAKTWLVYRGKQSNELRQLTPEEFNRIILLEYSSNQEHLNIKPVNIKRSDFKINNQLSMTTQSAMDYVNYPCLIDE